MLERRIGAMALATLAVLSGCTRSTTAPDPAVPIRLGAYEWPGNYWIDVAWQKGWFADAGLKVERIDAEGKYFESLDSMVAGQIDAMGFSQFDLVRYVAAGHDLIGVAAIDYSDGAEALVARPGIHDLRNLRGKRIALHRGTYLEYLLDIAAEREGMQLSAFILIDQAEEQAIEDLKAGRVDAVFVWEPYATRAQDAVDGTRLFSTADFPGLTYNVLALPHRFVTEHPAEVETLLRVWSRVNGFIEAHPEEAYALVAKLYHQSPSIPRDMARTDRILDLVENQRAFSYAAGFESLHGSWRRMNDFMMEHGLAKERVSSTEHLDSRFLTELDRSKAQ
jgi:NitT/TauT family transport system substrate-binding protein